MVYYWAGRWEGGGFVELCEKGGKGGGRCEGNVLERSSRGSSGGWVWP